MNPLSVNPKKPTSAQPATQPPVKGNTISPDSKSSTQFTPAQNAPAAIFSDHTRMAEPSRTESRLNDTQPAQPTTPTTQNAAHKRSQSAQSANDLPPPDAEETPATRPGKRARRGSMYINEDLAAYAERQYFLQPEVTDEQVDTSVADLFKKI